MMFGEVKQRNYEGSILSCYFLYNVRPFCRRLRLCSTQWRNEGGWTEKDRVSWKMLVACSD
jgi:hypothetical protein